MVLAEGFFLKVRAGFGAPAGGVSYLSRAAFFAGARVKWLTFSSGRLVNMNFTKTFCFSLNVECGVLDPLPPSVTLSTV